MQVGAIKVKIRGRDFIEREAERLLAEYVGETGAALDVPVPVEEIARYHLCLKLEFADLHDVLDLPKYAGGPDILGAMFFEQSAILIDDRLNPDVHPEQLGRYRFSLGHEIGHWQLHRDAMTKRRLANASQPAFICRQSDAVSLRCDPWADPRCLDRSPFNREYRIQCGHRRKGRRRVQRWR